MEKAYNPYDWYWLKEDGTVYSSARNAEFPADDPDYLAWQDSGGVPTPYPKDNSGRESRLELMKILAPYGIKEPQEMFTDAIQKHLDVFAQTRNYDNILSAATYATSTVLKFQAEGQYAVEARDATWAKGYEILDAVLAGQRPMPSLAEVLAELPPLAWPE